MARAIWKGSLSFGLVNVPVELVSAVIDRGLHFHLLHDEDGARIKEQRVCSKDGEEVSWEHTVRGYEVAKGHDVTLTDEELAQVAPQKSKAIALESFVPLDQINPVYFQHPYYLRPAEGAEAPYALMREVIARSQRVGIARMVMRGKESLVAVRTVDSALSLSVLWFADEVVEPRQLEGLPKAGKAPAQQLALAQQLIDALAEDFQPEKYKDTYRERVLEVVHKKAKGEAIEPAKAPEPASNIVDLMSALKASLAQTGSSKGKSRAPRSRAGPSAVAAHSRRKSA
jgi:DNA end-binding protein Ku